MPTPETTTGRIHQTAPAPSGAGTWIRRARRVARLSQRDLAARVGVSQSTVARWETHQAEPSTRQLIQVLDTAGLRLALVDRSAPRDSEVPSMRDDAARDRGGRRRPAHHDPLLFGRWRPEEQRRHDPLDPRWLGAPRLAMIGQPWWRDYLREVHSIDATADDHPTPDELEVAVRRVEAGLPPGAFSPGPP